MIDDGADVTGTIRPWDLLPTDRSDLAGATVVVVTARAQDTATFTGSTIMQMRAAGARVVVVATSQSVAEHVRVTNLLGVDRLVPLGLPDRGRAASTAASAQTVDVAARLVAGVCLSESADALIHYGGAGIDGDADRVVAHQIGATAARIARVTSYEATLDPPSSDCIMTSVAADVITLTGKRLSMLAQATLTVIASVQSARFADTYGLEWFARKGSPGVLDRLADTA